MPLAPGLEGTENGPGYGCVKSQPDRNVGEGHFVSLVGRQVWEVAAQEAPRTPVRSSGCVI